MICRLSISNRSMLRVSSPAHHKIQTKLLLPQAIASSQNNKEPKQPIKAGTIKRQVLSNAGRTKLNIYPDRDFYAFPRFVTHVDDNFIATLTDVYRKRLRPGSEILDLMSSWVSHLPPEGEYKRVVGHGLNAQELARNPRLDCFFVKDLNQDQRLEMQDCNLDAVLCTVSVQYLEQPEKVITLLLSDLQYYSNAQNYWDRMEYKLLVFNNKGIKIVACGARYSRRCFVC